MVILFGGWMMTPFVGDLIKLILMIFILYYACGYIIDSSISLLQLNIDFISGLLILLSAFILILMNLSAPPSLTLLLIMIILMVDLMLLFSVNNIMYFYLLFEFSLIPMSIIILGWGGQPERMSASVYMLFYTIISALPFLMIVISRGAPDFQSVILISSSSFMNLLVGWVIILPFLIKTPMFLFHLWLPKAHVEAPVYGSMILAGVLLKIGGYGLWRMALWCPVMGCLFIGVVSIVGGSLASVITMMQVDIKALIAYSSIVHMSMITLAVLFNTMFSPMAGLIMLVGHGLCSSGLFYLGTMNYERFASRSIVTTRGILMILPSMAVIWGILILMNLSAPPSLTLLSEILMIFTGIALNWFTILFGGVIMLMGLLYSLFIYYNYYHMSPTWMYPINKESIKELTVGWLHGAWWLLSPLLLFLFECPASL